MNLRSKSLIPFWARRLIKISCVSAIVACSSLTLSQSSAAAVPEVSKIAFVDMQRVLSETNEGKKARKNLESSFEAKQKKLDKKRTQLESDQAKIKNLDGKAQQAAAEKLQRDFQELQSMYMTLQQDLANQEGKLLEEIYKKTQTIVTRLAKELTLDLVLIRDQNNVIFVQESLDITASLIKRYNKKHKATP